MILLLLPPPPLRLPLGYRSYHHHHHHYYYFFFFFFRKSANSGIAQWLERRIRDWKVLGSSPARSGGRSFFSRVNFLCWHLLRYPFHPRVTAVARKRSRSLCQKCQWQVTTKHTHTPYLCGFEWSDIVNWCMFEWCTQNLRRNGSISRGTSHATTTERYQYKHRALPVHHFRGY